MKKVAIYTRVSSVMQLDNYSLDSQLNLLREYCERNNYTIIKVYTDEAQSARSINKRFAFQQMINDATHKKFDTILIFKLNRFARNLKDLVSVTDQLIKNNINLLSYTENIDVSTIQGRFMLNLIGAFAEFDSENIGENLRYGRLESSKQGAINAHHAALGYDRRNSKLYINKKEACIVRFIFNSYIETKNLSEVCRLCAEKNYRGKRNAKLQHVSQIKAILANPIFCGYATYKREILYKKKTHKAIIDELTFNEVQKILNKKKQTNQFRTIDEYLKE